MGSRRAYVLGAVLLFLLLWQAAAMLLNEEVLPTPTEVLRAFGVSLPRELGWHLLVSAYRVALGLLLAVVIGAPLGILVGLSRRWDALVAPLVYLTYPIPKIVFLPLLLMFLGLGDLSKVAMLFLILFFQVLIVVRDASIGVRPELIHSVQSLGARRRHLLRYVYWPACLPAILTALRVSTGTAIAVLFFVESFGTTAGLGYFILVEAWGRLAYAQMYAGVVAMSFLGLGVYFALDALQRRLCPWAPGGAAAA